MISPISFMGINALKESQVPEGTPRTLIMDIEEPVKKYHETINVLTETEIDISEMLDEIMIYLSDISTCQNGIESMSNNIKNMYQSNHLEEEGIIVADATVELALVIKKQAIQNKLYTDDGELPYIVGGWINDTLPLFKLNVEKD